MNDFPYPRLAAALADDPALYQFLRVLPYMTLSQRKAVLTCSRVQSTPEPGTLLRSQFKDEWGTHVYDPQAKANIEFLPLILNLRAFLRSQVLSGFISMITRNAPWTDHEDIKAKLQSMISKELDAAQQIYHPECLDWDSVFSTDQEYRHTHSLRRGYPVNPSLNDEIYYSIVTAFRRIASTPLYPDYSKKTLGREATRTIQALGRLQGTEWEELAATTYGLELNYHQFGDRFPGPTEVRWAWKYNDLQPRVYYARGPDQYYDSRYIQAIFNALVDSLPNTHRFQRFMTSHIRGDESDMAVLYDYSSFTSLFDEAKCMITSLARLAGRFEVTVIDTFEGPITRNLGVLLGEWKEACCDFPAFDASRILGDPPDAPPKLLLHTCGMLGVPGDISSKTLGHGIHFAEAAGSTSKTKVVGDDAAGRLPRQDKEELQDLVSPLGMIAPEKFVTWEVEEGEEVDQSVPQRWHYTKRPVEFYANRFTVGTQVQWPSAAAIFLWTDDFHTTLPKPDEHKRIKKTCSYLLSLALQFRYVVADDDEIAFTERFMRIVRVKVVESSPVYRSRYTELVIPRSLSGGDVVGNLVDQYWNSVLVLPVMSHQYPEDDPVREFCYVGRMRKPLALAKDLGYAEVVPKMQRILVSQDPGLFMKWLSKDFSALYDITIFENVPLWLWRLIDVPPTSNNDPGPNYVSYDTDSDEEP